MYESNQIVMKKSIRVGILVSLIVLIIVVIQSCATSAMPSEPLRFRKETALNGLMIGSITFPKEKAKHNGYYFSVISKDADPKKAKRNFTEIAINPEQIVRMKHKGELDGGLTYLFIIEKPEGSYEISGIRLADVMAYGSSSFSVKGFSIPFDVKKGEITYVGNLFFDEEMNNGHKIIELSNNFDKDIQGLKKVQPMTDWRMVIDKKEYPINYN